MTRGMALSGQWLSQPCTFLQPSADMCSYCQDAFSFWSSRKHCEYCGSVVHSRCTTTLATSRKKYRICHRCSTYKNVHSTLLTKGDEFIAYTGVYPAPAFIYLSEEKCCLLLTIDPSNVEILLPLSDIVSVQRGFSHGGHMRAASSYDPLKCFSITFQTNNVLKSYDLKTHSAVHCQQWLTGLDTALHVFRQLQEQEKAISDYTSLGQPLPKDKHLYFPSKQSTSMHTTPESSIVIVPSAVNRPTVEVLETSDMVVVDFDDDRSSRDATPTSEPGDSPVVHKAHYKIRTLNNPKRNLLLTKSDKLALSTDSSHSHGLPYKGEKNPLASNCSCHAYAIEPIQVFLFPTKFSPKTNSPFSSCCERCRGKCSVIYDLGTF